MNPEADQPSKPSLSEELDVSLAPAEASAAGISQAQWERALAMSERGEASMVLAIERTVGAEKARRYESFVRDGVPAPQEETVADTGPAENLETEVRQENEPRKYIRSDEKRALVAELAREAMASGDPAEFWKRNDVQKRALDLGINTDEINSLE